MIQLLKTLILVAMIGLPYGCIAQDLNGIKELVARRLPALKEHIVSQTLKGESNETFILSTTRRQGRSSSQLAIGSIRGRNLLPKPLLPHESLTLWQ